MIPFKEICEFLTNYQQYSWFNWSTDMSRFLDEEDKKLVHIEDSKDGRICRIWYPEEKYWSSFGKTTSQQMLIEAFEKEDWRVVRILKERISKL